MDPAPDDLDQLVSEPTPTLAKRSQSLRTRLALTFVDLDEDLLVAAEDTLAEIGQKVREDNGLALEIYCFYYARLKLDLPVDPREVAALFEVNPITVGSILKKYDKLRPSAVIYVSPSYFVNQYCDLLADSDVVRGDALAMVAAAEEVANPVREEVPTVLAAAAVQKALHAQGRALNPDQVKGLFHRPVATIKKVERDLDGCLS